MEVVFRGAGLSRRPSTRSRPIFGDSVRHQFSRRSRTVRRPLRPASASTSRKTCILAAQIAIAALKKKIREVMLRLMSCS